MVHCIYLLYSKQLNADIWNKPPAVIVKDRIHSTGIVRGTMLLKVSTVSAFKTFTHEYLATNVQNCILGSKQTFIRGHGWGSWDRLRCFEAVYEAALEVWKDPTGLCSTLCVQIDFVLSFHSKLRQESFANFFLMWQLRIATRVFMI